MDDQLARDIISRALDRLRASSIPLGTNEAQFNEATIRDTQRILIDALAALPDALPAEEWEDPEPWFEAELDRRLSRDQKQSGDARGRAWRGLVFDPRTREQYEADQKPVVPVDALGFPTQDGASFTAVEKGPAVKRRYRMFGGEVFKGRTVLPKDFIDHTSIEDVRPADGRNGQ